MLQALCVALARSDARPYRQKCPTARIQTRAPSARASSVDCTQRTGDQDMNRTLAPWGATKAQSYKADNPRALLFQLAADNPQASREELLDLCLAEIEAHPEYIESIVEYWFINNYRSYAHTAPRLPSPGAAKPGDHGAAAMALARLPSREPLPHNRRPTRGPRPYTTPPTSRSRRPRPAAGGAAGVSRVET